MAKRYGPVITLVLVLALVGVAWWLNNANKGETSACAVTDNSPSFSQTCPPSGRPASSTKATRIGSTRASTTAPGGGATDPETGLRWIEASALPAEAQPVLAAIDKGGPYAYDKDGTTFGNLEGVLPKKPRGFYKEYTVKTPGEGDRGARRIVTGDNDRQFFWTADHYQTFARVKR